MPLKKLQALLVASASRIPQEPTSLTEVDGLMLIRSVFEATTGDEACYADSQHLTEDDNPEGHVFVELFVSECILREYLQPIPPGRPKFELYYRLDLPPVGSYPDLKLALRALFLEDQKIRFEREWCKVFPLPTTPAPAKIRKILDDL